MGGSNYAGVDWAAEKHDVLVEDVAGERLLAATFAHGEQGLRSLCRQLVRLKVRLVAIERPDGLLVERLLDAGLRVLALHPNQVAAARERFRASEVCLSQSHRSGSESVHIGGAPAVALACCSRW
jgi:transposase